MSQESGKGFYQAATYLGQNSRISRGILKETACMAQDERVLIADLEAVKKVWPFLEQIEDMPLDILIDKIILPFIENEGYANWQRDVVTDMAMKKGDMTKSGMWRNKKDKDEEINE